MLGLKCSTICSRDMDVDSYRQKHLKCGYIWRRMEKTSWLDEALRRVNEDRQILNSIWQRKH